MTSRQDWVFERWRGLLYQTLSSFYRQEPSRRQVSSFLDQQAFGELEASLSSLGSPLVLEHADQLSRSLREVFSGTDEDIPLEIRREFAGLFLRRGGVKPYESVYRGTEKRLMDWPWAEVREIYRRYGFSLSEEEEHPEDHLSVELGFMALLSALALEEEGSVRENILGQQVAFLQDHLLEWVPDMAKDVDGDRWANVYRPICHFCASYLKADFEVLREYRKGE